MRWKLLHYEYGDWKINIIVVSKICYLDTLLLCDSLFIFCRVRIQRNLGLPTMFGFTLLHQPGMGILLMARQVAYVYAALFIMTLRLERRTRQRRVFAVISFVTQSQERKFSLQVGITFFKQTHVHIEKFFDLLNILGLTRFISQLFSFSKF